MSNGNNRWGSTSSPPAIAARWAAAKAPKLWGSVAVRRGAQAFRDYMGQNWSVAEPFVLPRHPGFKSWR